MLKKSNNDFFYFNNIKYIGGKMHISDLQNKSIVDIATGKNLGKIIDLILDEKGNILELIIERKKFFLSFLSGDTVTIKWNNINKIGEDVILICIDSNT